MEHLLEKSRRLDKADLLASIKQAFVHRKNEIYLNGNSLGKLPIDTIDRIKSVVENEWGTQLVGSWNKHWLDLSKRIATKIAQIVGARDDEVFVGDTTSMNLFKLAFASLEYNNGRNLILTDELNFPSDHYVLQGLVEKHFPGHALDIVSSKDGISITKEEIERSIHPDTALISLSHVSYKSAYRYHMVEINKIAQNAGALMIWDLSHSVGAVPIDLNKSGAQLAVGCTYKYLNGGPGSPAFLYVKKELQEKLHNPVWSWFSHNQPFAFSENYKPDPGINRFGLSTPGILSLAAAEPGIDLLLRAGLEKIYTKSKRMIDFLLQMVRDHLLPLGFELASPEDSKYRGSHIALSHPDAYSINRAMKEPMRPGDPSIITDFRPPKVLRLGITPMYTSYEDIAKTVIRIKAIINSGEHKLRQFDSETVT